MHGQRERVEIARITGYLAGQRRRGDGQGSEQTTQFFRRDPSQFKDPVKRAAGQVAPLRDDDQPNAALRVSTHQRVVTSFAPARRVLEAGATQCRDELTRGERRQPRHGTLTSIAEQKR